MSLEDNEDSGDGREAQFKSRMSRMIEKQKEVIARARDPGLNPDERRKASHDVVLNMMGQPTLHAIDSALAEANNMPPEEAAEMRKAAMEAIAGNVRMMPTVTASQALFSLSFSLFNPQHYPDIETGGVRGFVGFIDHG